VIHPGGTVDLATDLSILVLPGVEVIERADRGYERTAILAEHRHEARVPEKNVLVKRSVDELRYHPAGGRGLMEVVRCEFPSLPIEFDQERAFVVDGTR